MAKHPKNTICLWYNGDAEEAAQFYAKTFPDSSVGAVLRAPGDFHSGKKGDVLTVEFSVMGIPCLGLNGGPMFKHNEAFSFQVATYDQAETDRYWNAIIGNGGQESACGDMTSNSSLATSTRRYHGSFGAAPAGRSLSCRTGPRDGRGWRRSWRASTTRRC